MNFTLSKESGENKYYLFFFIIVLTAFGVSSWINVGVMSYDEHYQILEFAHYKRGLGNPSQLAWEYEARIRAAIQPTIAYILIELMNMLTITDPFNQAFILRVLSGIFSIFCIYRLFMSLRNTISSPVMVFLFFVFSFLFYRLPYLGVRFGSENWSSCFAVWGISLLFDYINDPESKTNSRNFFLTGTLFGLSFLFRYQSAILLVGIALWACVYHFKNIRYWLIMFLGFVFIIVLGFLIDRWFYGEWVLTTWNYFRVNLLEGKASEFGTEPWWWYFKALLSYGKLRYFEGLTLLLILLFMVREFKNPITWMLIPFLGVHFLIPHKEFRFISPMFYFVPYMVISSLDYLYVLLGPSKRILLYLLFILIFTANSFAVIASVLHVSDNSMEIYKYLRTVEQKPVKIYHNSEQFYYTLSNQDGIISPNFYKNGRDFQIDNRGGNKFFLEKFIKLPVNKDTVQYLILSDIEEQQKVKGRLEMVYDPYYEWIRQLNYRGWMRTGFCNWKLYKKKSVTTLAL